MRGSAHMQVHRPWCRRLGARGCAMERMTLSQRDLETMMRIVSGPDEGDPGEPLPLSVLASLAKLIGVDSVTFQQLDSKRFVAPLDQEFPDEERGPQADAIDAKFWTQYWDCLACSYPDSTGDVVNVTRLSDFYSTQELHNTGMWAEVLRPNGSEREMMLCLPSRPGNTLRLVLWRGPGLDFSERDRALLTLLRPHLYARCRHCRKRAYRPRRSPCGSGSCCDWSQRAARTTRSRDACRSPRAPFVPTWRTSSTACR